MGRSTDRSANLERNEAAALAVVDWEQLRRHAGDLVKLAETRLDGHVRRKEDAEDVVQSAFKSFWRLHEAGRIDTTGNRDLLGLLVVITRRKCLKRMRDYRRSKRDIRRETARLQHLEADQMPVQVHTPPDQAAMFVELMEDVCQGLDARERQILALAVDGFTQVEIAAQVKLSERTVRRVLQRVKLRLTKWRETSSTTRPK